MRISLVTPSLNQGRFIGQTIRSVLDQAGDFELDYQVLDGGSTDATADVAAAFGNRLRWRSGPDGGQINAINRGLREAGGEVVGWLNSDDVLEPGALTAVADAFADPAVMWVHGGCRIIDAGGREIRPMVTAYKRYHARRYSRRRLLGCNFISQMTVFWRREIIQKVGLLDESLPLAFDYDYWLRLAAVAEPVYLDRPIAAFRWHGHSKSGRGYVAQSAEDLTIALRHGQAGAAGQLTKRLHNAAAVGVYRMLERWERRHDH